MKSSFFSRLLSFALASAGVSAEGALVTPASDSSGYRALPTEFNLRSIETMGDRLDISDEDDGVTTVPIGFSFTFYGQQYEQVEVSSNGFMTFTVAGDPACCSGERIATPGGRVDNFVAGYWQDLDPSEGGDIFSFTSGLLGEREFVIGFYSVTDNDSPSLSVNTFEMILHESSHSIELQYGQVQYDRFDDKVIGIENSDGSDGIELLFLESGDPNFNDGDFLARSEGVIFTIPEPSTALLSGLAIFGFLRRKR